MTRLTEGQKAGVLVVAVAADSRADAEATVAKHDVPFPVAYGVDPDELAKQIGNYVGTGLPHHRVQSTHFRLNQHSRVRVAVYSSAAIGRFTPPDVLGLPRASPRGNP
jgi:hypothetical protein